MRLAADTAAGGTTTKRVRLIRSLLLATGVLMLPAAGASAAVRGTVLGTVVSAEGSSFTVQTPGRQGGMVNAMVGAASRVGARNYPYVYGGGHEQAGVASIGIPGRGYNGHRVGFDCSGAVAAVLVGGGLWPAYSGVPADNGIIRQLRQEGKIAPGVGRGPVEVTLYDDPGVHIFMNVNGRFFGTSDGGGDGRGGSWLNDGAPDASSRAYHAYHVLPAILRSGPSGELFTFQAESPAGLEPGDKVKVSYRESRWGSLIATAVTFREERTTNGTVSWLGARGRSLAITAPDGSARTFSVLAPGLLQNVAVGDAVLVTYTRRDSQLTAREVVVTATPVPTSGPSGPASGPSGLPPSPSTP
jgi:hypothetical protein